MFSLWKFLADQIRQASGEPGDFTIVDTGQLRCYDDLGEYPRAFDHLQRANRLKRQRLDYQSHRAMEKNLEIN